MEVVINVGASRHRVCVEEGGTVRMLMEQVAVMTLIKEENQKLIFKGVTISKDPDQCLTKFGLRSGSKIMLIGKRYDIEEEKALKTFQIIEKDVQTLSNSTKDMETQLNTILKGFLAESLKAKAFQKLLKQLNSLSHTLMKHLENIDAMLLSADFKDAKVKRKTVVQKIQSVLDRCDHSIELLKENL